MQCLRYHTKLKVKVRSGHQIPFKREMLDRICGSATHALLVILFIECNVYNTLAICAIVRSNLGKGQVKVRSRSGQVRSHFDVDCED